MKATYFDATATIEPLQFERVIVDDDTPPFPGRRPYGKRNIVVAVIARAHLALPQGGKTYIRLSLDSPGCWGVEVKDRSDPYLDTVFDEEVATLKGILAQIGGILPPETPASL